MFSLSVFKKIVFHTKHIIALMLLLTGSATSVADTPQQDNPASVKPVESPSADSSLFDLGWNYYVDTKHPAKAIFKVNISALDKIDLCKLNIAFFNTAEQRYEIVAKVRPDDHGLFDVPIEREGTYSLITLPSLPYPVDEVRQLCALPGSPEAPMDKPLLDDFCKNVYCPAFKDAGLPKPFAAEAACQRCYGLSGRAPRDIAECGLLTFDEKSESSIVGPEEVVTTQYRCDGSIAIAKFPKRIIKGSYLPLVLYVHGATGNTQVYRQYDYFLERLAQYGFVAVSIDTSIADEFPNQIDGVRFRANKVKKHLDCWRDRQLQTVGGADYSLNVSRYVDFNRIGLAGHSQGGEAIVVAAEGNRDENWGYGIKAIHGIAPSDWLGLTINGVPYLVLVAAADIDTDYGRGGIRVYDRAIRTAPKIQAFLYDADHSSFSTVHREVESTIALAFFRHFLQGFRPARNLWAGQAEVSSLQAFRLYWSYQDPIHTMVDTFEPGKNVTSPFRNDLSGQNESIPGRITDAPNPVTGQRPPNPLSPLEEVWLDRPLDGPRDPDERFHHPTHGLKLGWNPPSEIQPADLHRVSTGRFELHIPPEYRNSAAGKPFLAFRVAQYFDNTWNVRNQAQDFEVGLEDEDGTQGYIKVSNFAEIPWPFERTDDYSKSVLQTVRLPLCAFAPENASHKVDLDTSRISKILFRFNERERGLIALDDIQFTE